MQDDASPLAPFARVLFMEAAKGLNRRASAKFARRQAQLGRPVPKRVAPTDRPAPWLYDNEEYEAGDA